MKSNGRGSVWNEDFFAATERIQSYSMLTNGRVPQLQIQFGSRPRVWGQRLRAQGLGSETLAVGLRA